MTGFGLSLLDVEHTLYFKALKAAGDTYSKN
jgi:hypothetical protein